MQRFVSRSQFPVIQHTFSFSNTASGHDGSAWCKLIGALAALLLIPGLSVAQTDNILLDFTASWCGPCQQMSSIVSRLERQGLPIRKVDVDKEPQLAAMYGVKSIPCFVLVADGKELDRVNGLTTEQQLRSMMNRLPKSPPVAKESSRNPGSPDLGQPIPITPPGRNDEGRDRSPDFGPGGPKVVRGQPPEGNPLRSSVRLRVKDGNSINYGSATIIDSEPGRAILVSCGHIFRDLSKKAVIEVDVYTNVKSAKPDMIPGTVILADMTADVSLVSISYPQRLPSIRLSSLPLAKGEKLFSIGCSGGDNPSREDVQLTAINKYNGPDNLECTGRPQKGRSGGGLFREDELVGVCIAADPKDVRGIYAGLQPIINLLDKAGLSHIAPRSPKSSAPKETDELAIIEEPPVEKSLQREPKFDQIATTDDDISKLLERELNVGPDGEDEFAGAEVICIVRSRTPGKPSRVVIVNRASERFVADLLHESGAPGRTRESDLSISKQTPGESGTIETSLETQPFRRARPR
ncbi:MAG: thioredoxin domain-containing protein [Planctomycetaceae bacterium]